MAKLDTINVVHNKNDCLKNKLGLNYMRQIPGLTRNCLMFFSNYVFLLLLLVDTKCTLLFHLYDRRDSAFGKPHLGGQQLERVKLAVSRPGF